MLLRYAEERGLPQLRAARWLDTLPLAMEALPSTGGPGEPPNRKLGSLYKFYTGREADMAHAALADCQYNLEVLARLLAEDGLQLGEGWGGAGGARDGLIGITGSMSRRHGRSGGPACLCFSQRLPTTHNSCSSVVCVPLARRGRV